MKKALPLELRMRVLAGVATGLTHRAAAVQFGVSATSVSRWRALVRERGNAQPKAIGGDRRSQRIEGRKDVILALLSSNRHLTIEDTRKALAAQGLTFGFGTVQRFFKRHGIVRMPKHAAKANQLAQHLR